MSLSNVEVPPAGIGAGDRSNVLNPPSPKKSGIHIFIAIFGCSFMKMHSYVSTTNRPSIGS